MKNHIAMAVLLLSIPNALTYAQCVISSVAPTQATMSALTPFTSPSSGLPPGWYYAGLDCCVLSAYISPNDYSKCGSLAVPSATIDVPWLALEASGGPVFISGDPNLQFSFEFEREYNPYTVSRTGHITIAGMKVTVIQAACSGSWCLPPPPPTLGDLAVSPLWQGNWPDVPYDHLSGYSIADYGCFITDITMIINFYASEQCNCSTAFTPVQLNSWLNQDFIFGYVEGSANIISAAEFGRAEGVNVFADQWSTTPDNGLVDSTLANGNPVMLMVSQQPPHWVLAIGTTDTGLYSIIDPASGQHGTLAPDGYVQFVSFNQSPTSTDNIALYGESPIELLMQDPVGRKTGVRANVVYSDIPRVSYSHESLRDDVAPQNRPPTPEVRQLIALGPALGHYTLTVFGTGLGQYQIDAMRMGNTGSKDVFRIPGIANAGSVTVYSLSYVATGSMNVNLLATFQGALADISNGLQLGLIKNDGIANSLSQKIEAAQNATGPTRTNILNAFINEVNAQSGKQITGVAPQVLLQDANSLIAQN
jgi:hypothetical protein